MVRVKHNKGGVESNDFVPEGKFLKGNWSSRDEQRLKRKSLKRHTKQVLRNILRGAADERE